MPLYYTVGIATLNNDIGIPTNFPTNVKENLAYISYDLNLDSCIAYALEHRPVGISLITELRVPK